MRPPPVSPTFRNQVAELVRLPLSPTFPTQLPSSLWADVIPPPQRFIHSLWSSYVEGIWPDVLRFHSQTQELDRKSVPQYAAFYRDDGPDGKELPILVEVPDLNNTDASYYSLINTLKKSNLRLDKVDPANAEQIFVDRLAEFLNVASYATSQSTPTIVSSNRKGDTVIYAKGYFTSTGTAFGISTASGYLAAGRYSFGIVDSGTHKWDGIVWSCPTTVHVNLP